METGQIVYRQDLSLHPKIQNPKEIATSPWDLDGGGATTMEKTHHLGRTGLQSELPALEPQPKDEPSQPAEDEPQEGKQERHPPALLELTNYMGNQRLVLSAHTRIGRRASNGGGGGTALHGILTEVGTPENEKELG